MHLILSFSFYVRLNLGMPKLLCQKFAYWCRKWPMQKFLGTSYNKSIVTQHFLACQRFGLLTKIQNKIDHTTQASSKRILMRNYFHKILKVFILLYTFTFQIAIYKLYSLKLWKNVSIVTKLIKWTEKNYRSVVLLKLDYFRSEV